MKFTNFIRPESIEEALSWAQKPNTVILGGMMWMRMQKRTVENAVDLSHLGLDRIEESETGISVGSYVTLRELETSPLFSDYTYGANRETLFPIVGVQFRNTATVGGSVYGRFGFSDVCTLLTSLGASVRLAGSGEVPMEKFMKDGAPKDVLTHILLPKKAPDAVKALAQRKSATDFPILTLSAVRRGERIRITMSPAPLRGLTRDFKAGEIGIPEKFVEGLVFRTDNLASGEYREHIAKVLLKRALTAVGG